MRSFALLTLLACSATLGAASCASGGAGSAAVDDLDARIDVRRLDARARDVANDVEEEEAATPRSGLDAGKRDAANPNPPPAADGSGDANDGAALPGQCFDVGLGQSRAVVKPVAGQIKITEWMPDPTSVTDANGEWFEVHAKAAFDLNGIQVGSTALGAGFVSANCVPASSGQYVLFAHGANGATNGLGNTPVDVVASVNLVNANGTLKVGIDGVVLDTVTWVTATAGKSIMVDGNGAQCVTPAAVTSYNGTDVGTPRAANVVDCP